MTSHLLKLRNTAATIDLPELPAGCSISAEIEIRAETEEAARKAFELLGGREAFEQPHTTLSDIAYLRMRDENGKVPWGSPLHVALIVPTGRERPVERAPFVSELFPDSTQVSP